VNPRLEADQVLLNRFVLGRRLWARASSELWLARDRSLDDRILLRVYDTPARPGGNAAERIKRLAGRYRRLAHPAIARVFDLYEDDQRLLVSMEASDGDVLAGVLEQAGPVPYDRLLQAVRPLAEAIQYLHENGLEHGCVDPEHVLVESDRRWVLLPGDDSGPAGSDLTRLGNVMAAAATGGLAPDDGRELNDLADRLHGGRTVPALLNQLVSDLRAADPSQRPAGMQEVLSRLDQLDAYLARGAEAPPPAEPSAPPPTPVATPAPAPPGAFTAPPAKRRSPVFWFVVAIVAVVAVLFPIALVTMTAKLRSSLPAAITDEPPAPPAPETAPGPSAPAGSSTVPPPKEDTAVASTPTPEAEAALGNYLAARRQADEIGAEAWGGEPYRAAAGLAEQADAAFVEGRYDDAARDYGVAAEGFRQIFEGREAALEELLADGRAALAAPDAERAATAFRNALLIDPGNAEATLGLRRAGTLDQLHELLAKGADYEGQGRLGLAHVEYASAVKLDPHADVAAVALERIKTAIADQEFQEKMSEGLDAFHRGDFDGALRALGEARQMRPESTEAAEAIEMVQERRLLVEVDRLQELASARERDEQWREARDAYRDVLAIDATIFFAQQGKARCEEMITLWANARHYLDDPEKLYAGKGREQAARIVEALAAVQEVGPKTKRLHDDLAEQVRLADTPVRVVLQSDERTTVEVYRVKQCGTFSTMALELRPGDYTVVGFRNGYKDVRLTLRVRPGNETMTLRVACTEPL
jgi:serine/threonine protein kinase/tetratricopeptide (TPR) repeat protein